MQDSMRKPRPVKPSNWDEKSYHRQKRLLTKAMLKFTIEELQQIVKQHNQAYILFDVAIDCLLVKMPYNEFNDFINGLYS
jgi:hypothetical protein